VGNFAGGDCFGGVVGDFAALGYSVQDADSDLSVQMTLRWSMLEKFGVVQDLLHLKLTPPFWEFWGRGGCC
jgi:hypothetical protein